MRGGGDSGDSRNRRHGDADCLGAGSGKRRSDPDGGGTGSATGDETACLPKVDGSANMPAETNGSCSEDLVMLIREPVVAGQFYPAGTDACRTELLSMLAEEGPASDDPSVEGRVVAGLVPHAGWVCSGAIAARVLRLLAERQPKTIVLFGGVHRFTGKKGAMFCSGRWETPLGPVEVDDRLAERILGHTNAIVDDPHAHVDEHSLEVQMPLIRHLFPGVKVVPISVPLVPKAQDIGDAVGRTLTAYDYDALIVGTTDLTHYGPRYGFAPRGVGEAGVLWAKDENDRRFVDMVCRMKAAGLVAEAAERRNACNAGAAAATIAAAAVLGATEGVLLEQTTSSEVLMGKGAGTPEDSVGYAGVVFV